MKRIIILLAVVVLAADVFAQAPQKMSYQAVIRDAGSNLIKSLPVGMKISILQGSISGTVVYTETQTPSTNANGLVTIEIGGGTGFNTIDWANGPYFIKTETDPTGGTSYTITGISQLLSVPYALFAKTAASYSETDPVFVAHAANGITGANITNWNNAYGWGNHSGLYRPLSYVPSWSEITSNPFSFVSLANNQLLKYSTTSSKWENWTPNFLTNFTETDPIFGAWNKSTGINITASQVSDFQTSVTNNAAVLLNTAKVTNATHTGDATGATALTVVRINGTSLAGLATGILKNTTSTGIPSIAVAGTDYLTPTGSAASLTGFPTFNQNTTGSSASFTGSLAGQVTGTQGATVVTNAAVISKVLTGYVSGAGTVDATDNILQAIQKLNGNNPAHSIGESYGGGIVFYVYDNGRHGLIAATADQSTGVGWTNTAFQSTVSNAVRDGINGGLANTERIIIQAGAGSYAAQLCANYKGGNYGDWYLPSKFELNLLYLQKSVVGGFAINYYWSSTENNSSTAWEQYFSNGNQTNSDKGDTPDYVRAIRAF
jgi:hypothetical protein